jgi:tetratricopeptide (TPR) repeat protein
MSGTAEDGSLAEELRYAELLVRTGLCPRDRVDAGLKELRRRVADGASPRPTLSEVLVQRGDLSQAQAESALPSLSVLPTRDSSLPPDAQAAAALEANRVGKYVKVSLLGSGGMGEVWKAWDGDLRRWVALKFPLQDSPEQLARFRREAQLAARIHHPNIAAVYEVGEAGGRRYIAMQFVPGRPLNAVDSLTPRLVAKLVREAALAIHAAHAQGTIHRDLKPRNLMVVDEGANRKVYVLDFGLARPASGDSSVSVTGSVVGTPSYMAPEQARGENHRVGPAADVYGLGATLYDVLARRPPFVGREPLEILRRVVDEDPAPLRTLAPAVDRDLETIVMTCLAKEPERRYASARDLADDLGRWLAGEPIRSRRTSVAYRASRILSRRKPLAIGFAAVGLVLLFTFVRERTLTSNLEGREQFMQELGAASFDLARAHAWIRQPSRSASEVREEIQRPLRSLDALVYAHPRFIQGWVVRAKARLSLMDLGSAEDDLRTALRLDDGYSPAWSLLARVQLEQQQLLRRHCRSFMGDSARRRIAELQTAIAESLRRGLAHDDSPGRWGLARTPEDDRQEMLIRGLRKAVLDKDPRAGVELIAREHQKTPWEEYARFAGLWTEDPAEREAWLEESMRLAPYYVAGLLDRAALRVQADNWGAAEADYTVAIDLQPGLAIAWSNRGRARLHGGNRPGGISDLDEGVRLAPGDAVVLFTRGLGHDRIDHFDSALADYEKAISLDPGFLSPIAASLELQARTGSLEPRVVVARAMTRIPKAWLLAERARISHEQNLLEMADWEDSLKLDPKNADTWTDRGQTWTRKKDIDRALADFQKAVELDPKRADAWRGLAEGWMSKGDQARAEKCYARLAELEPTSYTALAARGFLRLRTGNRDGAASDFEAALRLAPPNWPSAEITRAQLRMCK